MAAVLCAALLPLLLVLFRSAPAQADGVVSDCTMAGLAAAMTTTGNISFDCGGPTTITLTQAGGLNVDNSSFYTIDGGNVITLSGLDSNRLFNVKSGGALTLSNIILSNGAALGDQVVFPSQGGALLNDGGALVLTIAFYHSPAGKSISSVCTGSGGAHNAVPPLLWSEMDGAIDPLDGS